MGAGGKMKRLIISFILILALTNQAFAMGWLGGGGGGGSSAGASSGSGGKNNSNNNNNSNSISNTTANNTINSGNNSTIGGNIGGTEGQGSGGPSTNIAAVPTPELTTIFLLGSALFGLWGVRKKFKK